MTANLFAGPAGHERSRKKRRIYSTESFRRIHTFDVLSFSKLWIINATLGPFGGFFSP